jgi:hypothetical protein
MNKEREMLQRIVDYADAYLEIDIEFVDPIKELLAQPEQEPINFDLERMKLAVESPVSDVTVEGLIDKVKSNRVFYQEREPLSAETIAELWWNTYVVGKADSVRNFARAIEKAHGIGGE